MSSVLTIGQIFTCVNDLFKKQVNENPYKISLISQNRKLTYEELDQKSNQVARYLCECGVQSNTLVGCSLNNSLGLVICILGILKAGGVYLPLEPNYPQSRIEYMLKDANPPILLTESSHIAQFINFSGKLIQLDKDWKQISSFSENPLSTPISPTQLAYIIYTSGSTGQPKGIMVEHGNFAHGAVAHKEYYQEKLVGLLSSAISFDVSILMIFHLLSSGGTVYIPDSKATTDAEKLINIIENNSINYILCVPSLYSMILDKSRKLSSLKIVSLTGENIPNSILKLHPKLAPNAILYNEYGPTEYAIGTTIGKIYDPEKKKMYPINVGKPLPNTYIYVLDENLLPVPNGVKGEIFISGTGLAKGYLNNPELTTEKFIPFRSTILYKTGDFGRFAPDGNLEFLGRTDYQVKVRGNRVELGEIEHVICRYPQVNEASVICRKKPNGSKRLIAYFTTLVDIDIKQELNEHLTNILPKYMIPSAFIQLKSFPRTPNGKIDRDALLSMPEEKRKSTGIPSSNLEQLLSDIWKKVLHVKSVGMEDNFFDLGGDSLGIVRVQTMIEKELSVKISVTTLLQYSTISQLSQNLNQQKSFKESDCQIHASKRNLALQQFKIRAKR